MGFLSLNPDSGYRLRPDSSHAGGHGVIAIDEIGYGDVELIHSGAGQAGERDGRVNRSDADGGRIRQNRGALKSLPSGYGRIGGTEAGSKQDDRVTWFGRDSCHVR